MQREIILKGFDPESGERTWNPDDPNPALRAAFFEDLKTRAAAQTFFREFEVTRENIEIIQRIAGSLYPGVSTFTVSQFEDVLAAGIAAGEFQKPAPEPEAPAPVATAPTDKNGRPLTDAQKKWSEYRVWSENATADQRRERCQTDSGYRKFVQEQMRAEMNSQPIDGAVEQPTIDRRTASNELREFAANYLRMSSEEIHRLSKAATNPVGHKQFIQNVEDAARAGLI